MPREDGAVACNTLERGFGMCLAPDATRFVALRTPSRDVAGMLA